MSFHSTSDNATSPPPSAPPQRQPSFSDRITQFPLTHSLIAVTLLVFSLQWLSSVLLGFDLVLGLGAKDGLAIAQGQYWRFLSPVFIHGDILHVAVNMYSLYVIGPVIERFFGWRLTLVLYLLSGVAGVIASWYLTPQISIGASGAIFGLLGSLGAFLLVNRDTFGAAGKFQFRQIVLVALLNLTLGLSPGIDNWGHIGGFGFGALVAWFVSPMYKLESNTLDPIPQLRNLRTKAQVFQSILIAAILLVALTMPGLL